MNLKENTTDAKILISLFSTNLQNQVHDIKRLRPISSCCSTCTLNTSSVTDRYVVEFSREISSRYNLSLIKRPKIKDPSSFARDPESAVVLCK